MKRKRQLVRNRSLYYKNKVRHRLVCYSFPLAFLCEMEKLCFASCNTVRPYLKNLKESFSDVSVLLQLRLSLCTFAN